MLKNIVSIGMPILTFVYVSRILGPEGIGKVTFAQAFINYFLIFAIVGIPIYGVREISRHKNDKEALNNVFNELLLINIGCTLIVYSVLIPVILFVPGINPFKDVIFIFSLTIVFFCYGMDWLYQGMEDFYFITIRTIIFEIIGIALVLVFVKQSSDYLIYIWIIVLNKGAFGLVNLYYSQKKVKINFSKKYDLLKHFRPMLIISGIWIVDNIYLNIDAIMLGFIYGEKEVGLFTIVFQMTRFMIYFLISVSAVLLPRLSHILTLEDKSEFYLLIGKALNIIFVVTLPIIIMFITDGDKVLIFFTGNQFLGSTLTIKIMASNIFCTTLCTLLSYNILVPQGKEKSVFYSILAGAILNVGFNLILIPKFGHNGAAISSMGTHFVILFIQLYMTWEEIKKYVINKDLLKVILSNLVLIIGLLGLGYFMPEGYILLILRLLLSFIIYLIILLSFKNEVIYNYLYKPTLNLIKRNIFRIDERFP